MKNASPVIRTSLRRRGFRQALIAAAMCLATAAWAAPGITFSATDLVDLAPGEDLWQYDYVIAGPLGVFESANFVFGAASYSEISVVQADATLSALVTDPVPAFGLDGFVTATAIADLDAASAFGLSVQFIWTGLHTPGSQAYELLDDQFSVRMTGLTTAAVPEASSASMILVGLLSLLPFFGKREKH